MGSGVEKRSSGGGSLRLMDGFLLVAVGVVGVLVAFWALSAVAGFLWGIVKIVVVIAVVVGLLSLLMGRRRS